MTFAAIIPARYASQRLPGKLLELIGDKSVLQHTVERAQNSGLFETVTVATDDEKIFSHCEKHRIHVVMTSSSHISGTDRVAEAAESIAADVIVNIQGDEPFVSTDMLDAICGLFRNNDVQIGTLCHQIEEAKEIHDFNKVKVVRDKNLKAMYFSRQAIPAMKSLPYREWFLHHTYFRHIGIYGFRSDILPQLVKLQPTTLEIAESLEQLRWLENGFPIHVEVVTGHAIGVDTAEDLAAAREWFSKHHK